ncbi:ABC transporter ATP-binding protein [Aneurinibacillus tyrosinisolvens]|uniref:ABC transporter ATP-binding protein n=1 Tax=Aneurinibacillus tyrosinisolvens TaxID=1443435 RepID=UPI00063EDE09|nr:ABC transporter ATP-binding protein [Aneurinibacillus tyrosinisolvens]
MIEITGLTQSYRHKEVLRNVDLVVRKHEICALVGRNGAGKSTLIQSLLGLLQVKTGMITLGGFSHREEGWKRIVSYLPEKFQLYPHLTGEENMKFFASLGEKPIDEAKIEECLRMVQLLDHGNEQVKKYSKGMLQRLGLGIMLYYETEILILDEPTSGLDPMGRREILSILQSLQNITILLSSHHMDEIRKVCTHVAYLHDGVITKFAAQEFCEQYETGGILL